MKLTLEDIERRVNHKKGWYELCLTSLKITDEDIPLICRYLIVHPEITTLYAGDNSIGDAGAEALSKNKTVTTLYIDNNYIGDVGAKALADNIITTSLYLWGNLISGLGAIALDHNTSLTTLNVTENQISEAGANAFVIALKNNTTLLNILHSFQGRVVNVTIQKLLAGNNAIHTYPQYKKLILAACAQKDLYQPLNNVIMPLSLRTLCAVTIISTTAQFFKHQQNKNIIEVQLIPVEVLAILISLRKLQEVLITTLCIATLPHYGIGELSTLSENEKKKLKI